MEEISTLLDQLKTEADKGLLQVKKRFYKLFCGYKFIKENEENFLFEYLLPTIYTLYSTKVLRKDIVYLTLIAYGNLELLQICIKYDKTVFKLKVECPASLYDYCLFKKHWFDRILRSRHENTVFNKDVWNKILTMRLIQTTNLSEIDVDEVKIILQKIHLENLESFWKYYVQEIHHLIDLFNFYKNGCSSDVNEFFSYTTKNSTLDSLSKYIKFSDVNWNDILDKIRNEENLHQVVSNHQSEAFESFLILGNIFRLILLENNNININEIIEDIKRRILDIKNVTLQITLLENLFVTIFMKNNHLLDSNLKDDFICKERDIRLVLHLLKVTLDEITLKNMYAKDSPEYSRFINLSKDVTDAMWRMELVTNVKDPDKYELRMLKYMLASPQSLIQMCLKKGDFKRAYQVIEIFSLDKDLVSSEIKYAETLQNIREKLKRSFKIKALRKVNPNIAIPNADITTDKNETFMNLLDLAITQPRQVEDCQIFFQLISENNTLACDITSNYEKFYKKIVDLYENVGKEKCLTPGEVLLSSNYLNLNRYTKEEEFYNKLAEIYKDFYNSLTVNECGIFDPDHPSHKILLKLNSLCNDYVDWRLGIPENIKYLSKLYNYLKAFSKILYIEQDSSNIISEGKHTSFFNLLYHNRSELTGKLLFERNLDPSEFEKYFGKLKLDYLYHFVGNCFPTINLHTQANVAKEELYPENSLYIPSKSIISYIQKRNWLLAFMLNKIYEIEGVNIDVSEVRIQTFLNYMRLPKIQHLKVLFGDNEIVSALQNDISQQKVSDYLNEQILKNDCLVSSHYSQNSNDSLETGQEIAEDSLKSTNWKDLFDVIDNIPENQLRRNNILLELRDMILVNIVHDGFETECFKFVQLINDTDIRINTILYNLKNWPDHYCINVIKSEITKLDTIDSSKSAELKMWLRQIQLCQELKHVLDVSSWSDAFERCETKPEDVMTKLLVYDKIDPLLDFIVLHKPVEELLLKVNQNYLTKLFSVSTPSEKNKNSVRFPTLQTRLDYLLTNVKDDELRNIELSLQMLSAFSQTEQEQLLCLIHDPINIIEMLVMNTKLDKLSTVLNILKPQLSTTEINEDILSIEKIDEVLRNYAEKSLDFRVITQPSPRLLRTPECKLMQSIDSLVSDSRGFVMPDGVPTKDQWVANNEVLECMSCQNVTFSMFNRRHHCRRCGRVVCYSCSLHRMLVESYGDILVRVCKDCYQQTMGNSSNSDMNDTISTKSIAYDYWLLTDDFEHNKIVREEFSYEHAPSVSLCLSIMKYHSKTVEYPKFLLDQCNIMLKLLQPTQEPVQEIDYLLVIKMLKSLAVAAKVSSIECTLHYGTSLADRILSQAELLGLLAERGCLNLLPVSSTTQGPYIDASVLRKLRDRLLGERTMEFSFGDSGLDVTGVFGAWGKNCLKAGSLLAARDKFQRCLDKNSYYENLSDYNSQSDIDETSENPTKPRPTSKTSNVNVLSETKPAKNPSLLNEIIYILESKTMNISSEVLKHRENQKLSTSLLSLSQCSSIISFQPDAAVCVLNKLKNLNKVSAGNYYQLTNNEKTRPCASRPSISDIFYEECIYYLTKYGTHLSLLEFYIRHGNIDSALNYIVDNQLSTEVFIDIYLKCLKEGIVSVLQEHMSDIDSTLDLWKNYLSALCRHLEEQQMLHCLYQLQQFMGDYIRAAMTCIRFYQEHAQNFSDLSNNVKFLHKAEEHLKRVQEQEQWVNVATVRRMSSVSRDSFEAKSITNPSLVMQMSDKEIDKHINTIWRQKEHITRNTACRENTKNTNLVRTTQEKLYLAVLAIICGKNVEDGFDVALRIIQDFKLKPVKVYCEAGKELAKSERYNAIGQLVSCIKHSGINDDVVRDMCDEMLTLAVATLTKANISGTKVEDLIKLISDRASKISAYIEAKQLKTAYFLAVKYKRMSDIRRILREADLLNQPNIKSLCQKVLQSHSHSPSYSRDN
ncbi:hypothetical protein NQ318_001182 [Aromia moschata]|uniref:FYVE-type domain-containing protein n=1 Tax=Aromia moschata TaxID=1265417 RepID=A0AAV8ZF47_9CUCU|nr:hypothetical protein NQ318_001182 [Aromia moschata]